MPNDAFLGRNYPTLPSRASLRFPDRVSNQPLMVGASANEASEVDRRANVRALHEHAVFGTKRHAKRGDVHHTTDACEYDV